MKKITALLSVIILIVLSSSAAIGAQGSNVSNVNVVNTPNVTVTNTVPNATRVLDVQMSPPAPATYSNTYDTSLCNSVRISVQNIDNTLPLEVSIGTIGIAPGISAGLPIDFVNIPANTGVSGAPPSGYTTIINTPPPTFQIVMPGPSTSWALGVWCR